MPHLRFYDNPECKGKPHFDLQEACDSLLHGPRTTCPLREGDGSWVGWQTVDEANRLTGYQATIINCADTMPIMPSPPDPPPPPAPPAPPPLEPGLAVKHVVSFGMTVAGTIETFDADGFTDSLAAVYGVPASNIDLTVSAGSLNLAIAMKFDNPEAAAAKSSEVASADPAALSAALGVEVTGVSEPEVQTAIEAWPSPPPSPPQPPAFPPAAPGDGITIFAYKFPNRTSLYGEDPLRPPSGIDKKPCDTISEECSPHIEDCRPFAYCADPAMADEACSNLPQECVPCGPWAHCFAEERNSTFPLFIPARQCTPFNEIETGQLVYLYTYCTDFGGFQWPHVYRYNDPECIGDTAGDLMSACSDTVDGSRVLSESCPIKTDQPLRFPR